MIENAALAVLGRVDPEFAHGLALRALHTPFAPLPGPVRSPHLDVDLAGLRLPNPVGLAAGLDKNASAVGPLMQAGFGFLEVGTATPRPQPGNPRPRLFRLRKDRAVINRLGFNNDGLEAIVDRLAARPDGVPVGINVGANRDSEDRAADYAHAIRAARKCVDFATINVSSPNTENLRDLQSEPALRALLEGVMAESGDLPVFLKISPDLPDREIGAIARTAMESGVAAIVATNTTLSRDGLTDWRNAESGGLSGRPLFARSTRVLARLFHETGGEMPLVGVGGVASAADAYAKIKAGAIAVQFYTAMTYFGMSLASRIARGVDEMLAHDGFASVAEARGIHAPDWLRG
ncbi:MAG: quinone-dependent dihydroorotate dehydrogenase [Boseongicola sp. SB0675_bin_26]|nr:quinone-dependent dihydroorotate dehydrogenase [Boseongicola sp. SB0675_bin_26]